MNRLSQEKRVLATSMLSDGSSIRSIERVLRIHRDSVVKLLVEVGTHCQETMDTYMRDLRFNALEVDEAWGFVSKKQAKTHPGEELAGDAYVFIASCPETKLVPHFLLGKRTRESTMRFVAELRGRVDPPLQFSSDAWGPYVTAFQAYFPGCDHMRPRQRPELIT